MPPVSPGLLALLVIALVGGGFAAGIFGLAYEDGQLRLQLGRRGRWSITFDVRDTWFLLLGVLLLGWSVSTAVEHSDLVSGSEKLGSTLLIATLVGWALAISSARRLVYLVLCVPGIVVPLALELADRFGGPPVTVSALGTWISTAVNRPQLALLAGLLLLAILTGFWTTWWVFRRRSGLVALLPSGTILAVEIINDPSPGLYFYTAFWLVAAASILLRLNFVALKERWRTRRVPRAADTGWVFGEIGFEATALLLVVAFLLPPLSSVDISTTFLPGAISTDQFHFFGIGSGTSHGGTASVGYSESVSPGAQLKARSVEIMIVSGDPSPLYPYLRGIALGRWDGASWDQLPATDETPVRQQPVLDPKADLPRDDLPKDPHLFDVVQQTLHILVPADQLKKDVFSAGELTRVDNHPVSIRGIVTAAPLSGFGPLPRVNVGGPTYPFDTVDLVRLADSAGTPYNLVVTSVVPSADVKSLRAASTTYPAWAEPYRQLYFRGAMNPNYTPDRDPEIAGLARSIVQVANASSVYDQAKAIEAWFRAPGRFTYTLATPPTPAGQRPLDYFLFESKKGYCQDFSTAMAVMLRTLGIPVRQMSGFSQGFFDEKTHRYLVNALNAHSWVEVYFPGYGWIPFEPTPDGTNSPIQRPATPSDVNVPLPAGSTAANRNRSLPKLETIDQNGGGTAATSLADILSRLVWVGTGLLVLLIAILLFMLRWLMSAREPRRIWRRLQFLADRLHVPRSPGDTPREFGGRLAGALPPPLRSEVQALAELYTRANFRRGGLTRDETTALQRSWRAVRRQYPRLVMGTVRLGARGRVRAGAGSTSRNRAPAPPR